MVQKTVWVKLPTCRLVADTIVIPATQLEGFSRLSCLVLRFLLWEPEEHGWQAIAGKEVEGRALKTKA